VAVNSIYASIIPSYKYNLVLKSFSYGTQVMGHPVIRYVTGKWPHEVETTIIPYFHRRNEISYEKGVLLWGYRIIIPDIERTTTE
jgi:hypothetical protein